MVNDEICGAVVSVRYQEDIISVWNRTASDDTTTTRIRDTLKRVLNLPPNIILDYKVIFEFQLSNIIMGFDQQFIQLSPLFSILFPLTLGPCGFVKISNLNSKKQ